MKQLNALVRKEWITHRWNILVPTLFALGGALVTLIGIIVNLSINGEVVTVGELPALTANQKGLILWGSGMGGTAFLGFIATLTAIFLADSMLNGGYKRRCELFHLSQPVSFSKIIGAKFGLLYLSQMLQILVIALIGGTVVSLYMSSKLDVPFYWIYTGVFQGAVSMLLPLLFVSSLFWFFSGLFKRKPMFMAILVVAAIDISGAILQKTSGIQIPSLSAYLFKLMSLGINVNIGPSPELNHLLSYQTIVNNTWHDIFDIYALQRVLLSIPLFLAGSWLYKRREIA